MPRPATGAPRWNKTRQHWEVRVTLADSSRSRPVAMTGLPACLVRANDPKRGCACASCEVARSSAAKVSRRMRKGAAVDVATSETANEWYERYHAYAVELGQTDAVKKQSRWSKWIAPKIGHKPMHTITRDDIEDIRDELDAAIAAWKKLGKSPGKMGRAITGKTAMNAWSCLTSSFKAMTSSKRRDLRVLDGKPNPCIGVEPPGDRDSRKARRKTFIWPKEAAAVLACELIPLVWREVYAIAFYTYARPGELRVLTWSDVDLDAGLISITKAWDYADEKIKPPKTANGVRDLPIEPTLVPLLKRMRKGKEPTDLVVPTLSAFGEDHLAEQWRRHLKLAKVTRLALHTSTVTHVQSNFRSCRDTGITWLAMAGLDVVKIMRRAGHDAIDTTMGYVKQTEDVTGDLGVPFSPLPPTLLGFWSSSGVLVEITPESPLNQCRRRESKPSESAQDLSTGEGADDREAPCETPSKAPVDPIQEITSESTAPSPVLDAESTQELLAIDPDAALRVAIRAALDAGDDARAEALMTELRRKPAPVLALRKR